MAYSWGPQARGYEYGQTSERTRKIRSLMEELAALAAREDASAEEVSALLARTNRDFARVDDVFVNAARDLLTQIVADGSVSDEERRLLAQLADTYENPISEEPIAQVEGRRFVLTGDFKTPGGKEGVADMIEAAGGRVTKSPPSKATSYVVVGALGSEAWAFGSYGQKVKRALDLRLSGQSEVQVVSEDALMSYFERNNAEVFDMAAEKADRFERQWVSARSVTRDFQGLTDGQRQAYDAVVAGENVYLSGVGGTGKSYVLNRIIAWAAASEQNVVVCAPTGIAALNVGGCTIHRALGIRPESTLERDPYDPDVPLREDSPLAACDLMIVDEISMCRLDLFDYLSAVLFKAADIRETQGKKPCQLVVVGDFSQLAPVLPREERSMLNELYGYDVRGGYPFMGLYWDKWNFRHVELTEAIRQRDVNFVAALNACRVGDTAGVRWIERRAAKTCPDNAIILCGTNAQAEQENQKRLDALPGWPWVYRAAVEGTVERGDMPTAEDLALKPGARVMALANRSDGGYMNGSLGTVVECLEDGVRVNFDGGSTLKVAPYEWDVTRPGALGGKTSMETIGSFTQIPLKLAYAITIHKAQGQTFEAVSVYPDCWDEGQLYTALSRATDVSGLHLAQPCPDGSLVTSQDVIDFQEGRPIAHEPIAKKPAGKTSRAAEGAAGKGSAAEGAATDAVSQGAAASQDGAGKGNAVAGAAGADGETGEGKGGGKAAPAAEPGSAQAARRPVHRWTPDEEEYLLAYPDKSAAELAEELGVSKSAVEQRRHKLRKEGRR